ncbi:MAG: hypothetical protein IJ077_08480 [Eubacterium sp.]|nr:hypothetical protein [Eubacterium sp.]
MITKKLQQDVVDFVYNKISYIRLLVNDTSRPATIKDKVKNGRFIDIYVDVLFNDPSDILNGCAVYDIDDNLLAKELPNLTYNVQSATYMFRIDVTSDKQILEE